MAESVDSQLRNTVRAARARSLRCVKAIIVQKGASLQVVSYFESPCLFVLLLIRSLTKKTFYLVLPREAPCRVEPGTWLPAR